MNISELNNAIKNREISPDDFLIELCSLYNLLGFVNNYAMIERITRTRKSMNNFGSYTHYYFKFYCV